MLDTNLMLTNKSFTLTLQINLYLLSSSQPVLENVSVVLPVVYYLRGITPLFGISKYFIVLSIFNTF